MGVKYIFVTGGVVSGLGKGITAASLGRLLKNRGYRVTIQKFDPYLNVDPGTMNPCEHGEVFVTEDGMETDLDLGHYERFIDENLSKESSITTGRIYLNVIERERRGEYLGKTIQVIPHITDEIKRNIYRLEDSNMDIVITEIGGTVGDMESLPFLEAIRQVGLEKKKEDVIYIHVTLLPYISGSNEIKSKPTQHSVKELQSIGIKPDILVCRTEKKIEDSMKEKIALFCNVRKECVISNETADTIYAVPILLEQEGLAKQVCNHLQLKEKEPNNAEWEKMIENIRKIEAKTLKVAIIGKYMQLEDAYLSVIEALKHAGFANQIKVEIEMIDSEKITKETVGDILKKYAGIVVPGGFGSRGIQGKIEAIRYARENNIAFLGICLGMQLAVIEFATHVLQWKDANSEEFGQDTTHPVIHLMKEQKQITQKGASMRLGKYPCILVKNSIAYQAYHQIQISERHRHRYEYNREYKEAFEEAGMLCSGISPDGKLVEMVEIPTHPFFVGCQFHPEFKSRPNHPSALFYSFIKTAEESRK